MAIYQFGNNKFTKVNKTSFSSEGILERNHLQAALKEQIQIVVPDCLVIAEEFSEWSGSQRRIDLLAVDKDANLVVIELKRNDTGEHMELQALRYAAMVSTLTFKRAIEIFQKYLTNIGREEDAETIMLEFLDWGEAQEGGFGVDVKIVLVSSNFSKELTTSVMWLNERNLDIRCVRLIPYKFEGKILINVQQVIPLPEAESYQIKIRQKAEEQRATKRSQRDYSKYIFEGEVYNKRRLVLVVVQQWISNNRPNTLSELLAAFPQETRKGKMFEEFSKAEEIYERQGVSRHFLSKDEIIRFPDSTQYVLSNQWGGENMERFLFQAKQLGFEIQKIN